MWKWILGIGGGLLLLDYLHQQAINQAAALAGPVPVSATVTCPPGYVKVPMPQPMHSVQLGIPQPSYPAFYCVPGIPVPDSATPLTGIIQVTGTTSPIQS